MGCGCGNKKAAVKTHNGPACPKCKWYMRSVVKYNLKSRRNETMLMCTNNSCKYSKPK